MGRLRRKRHHKNKKELRKSIGTKNRSKDLDQIQDEVKLVEAGKFPLPLDADLPGLGQNYCETCARHFVTVSVMERHKRTSKHRRMLKLVQGEQYTQEEADAAAGVGPPVTVLNKDKPTGAAANMLDE